MASRTPEVKKILDYLLKVQGPTILNLSSEQIYKGFMMAYYSILELQDMTLTTQTEE